MEHDYRGLCTLTFSLFYVILLLIVLISLFLSYLHIVSLKLIHAHLLTQITQETSNLVPIG